MRPVSHRIVISGVVEEIDLISVLSDICPFLVVMPIFAGN